MKYKVGDKVRIKDHNWYVLQEGPAPSWLYPCCGREMTIDVAYLEGYAMREVQGVLFNDFMIEGLVKDDNPFDDDMIPLPDSFVERMAEKIATSEMFNVEPLDIPTMTTDFVKEHGFPCPQGYQFVDENGNVINVKKIVLEKKKKEYPKTIEECKDKTVAGSGYKTASLLIQLERLLICRDAYWKIAGEEMGLGEPWKPNYDSGADKFGIICLNGVVQESNPTTNWERHLNKIFDFPTRAMRDAFYENFKELIESVKELL